MMKIPFDKTAFLEEMKSWVDYETPTGDEMRLTGFSSLVFHALEKAKAKVQTYPLSGGPVLHAVFGSGQRRCVLMGHMDTVFPFGEAEKYDKENGRLYGAGVLDMKSGLIMLVKAFEYLTENIPDEWRIEALINSDEERGSIGSRETLLSVLEGADLAFSFEGSPENCVTVSRKGVLTFEISAKGVAAHTSGGANREKNAIYLLSRAVGKIYDLGLHEGVSLNIGVIQGGRAVNVVADRAFLKGEIRGDSEEILFKAEEVIRNTALESRCEYRRLTLREPMPPNEKTMRLYKKLSEIEPCLIPRAAGGGGDAAFACLSGAFTIDGMGAEGARAHTRREYVTEESLERRFLFSVRSILKCMNEFESLL